MSRDGRIAILMDRHRRDVKCGLCLPLDLVVIEDRPRTLRDLGDGICERDVGGPPDVRLDHGRLAARSHDDQVPRMGDDRQIPRGRGEQEVNRLPRTVPFGTSTYAPSWKSAVFKATNASSSNRAYRVRCFSRVSGSDRRISASDATRTPSGSDRRYESRGAYRPFTKTS